MCTAATYQTKHFYFGRNLDYEQSFGESVVITPRRWPLPLRHGDAAYEFDFLANYRLRLIVWEGDEEFPPNAQLLYSANFAAGFAAEDRVVAGDLLITSLKSAM